MVTKFLRLLMEKILENSGHDGEFLCEEFAYQQPAIGGGNLIVGKNIDGVLKAAENAVNQIKKIKI